MKLILLTLLLSLNAYANDCAQDQQEFCGDVEPGKGRMMTCLSEHASELSGKCKRALEAFKSKTKAANPCFEDLAEFCSEMPPGRDRLSLCLLKNESRLSESCRKDFLTKKDKFLASEVCAQDLLDKCYGDLSKEEGMATRCLIKNQGKLQARCEVAMKSKVQQMRAKLPCFDDTEKFCPGTVNRGEIDACLEKKLPSLSKFCQGYIKREMAIAKKDPCYPQVKKFCRPGLSRAKHLECLDNHESELTSACKERHAKLKDKVKTIQETCEPDRAKYCASEPHAKGKILKCLRKNKAKISKACAALL